MGDDEAPRTVLIIDDHRAFAESLGRLLGDEPDIEVVGTASSGDEGLVLVQRFHPDVVLIDYLMPDRDGVEIAAEIRRRHPMTYVVVLTGSTEDSVMLAAIEAGCSGFVTKDRAASEIVDAIRIAADGEALISAAMLARLLPKLNRRHRSLGWNLSDRECEVLTAIGRGLTNKSIAAELRLSVNTVRNYVQSILTKLGAHSKLEAVAIAVREGIIDIAGP